MAYSLALGMVKNVPLAEEITQDAFLKAYKALPTFEGRSKFSTWLYKIVTNEALKELRKKSYNYTDDLSTLDHNAAHQVESAISRLQANERKEFINKSLDRLAENDSLVLRLFYLQECSLKEISSITGLTNVNIKTILHRARKRFFAVLHQELEHEMKSLL